MSILIKGMMMPEAGEYSHIRIYGGNGDVTVEDSEGYELTVGTAVPVPRHGDLIERDGAVRDLRMDYAYAAARIVSLQPTIIPAEEDIQKDGGQDEAPAGPYDLLYEEGGENLR